LAKLDLKLDGKVAVVTLDQDDNRLNLDLAISLLGILDRVEKETEALTLVVKSGHARVWSNGFDTDWINARLAVGDKEAVSQFLAEDIELRRRLLTYPLLTIAAINGHVFGGGAVLSCCLISVSCSRNMDTFAYQPSIGDTRSCPAPLRY